MSLPVRLDAEPEYLDRREIAEHVGVSLRTIADALRSSRLAEPDLVWHGVELWLVETVDRWSAQRRKHGRTRTTSRRQKVRTTERPRVRPPKLAKVSASRLAPKRPSVSTVSVPIAKQLAALLRADGHFCTTDDVLELADFEGELEHERTLLQARIRAKLRGLRERERRA